MILKKEKNIYTIEPVTSNEEIVIKGLIGTDVTTIPTPKHYDLKTLLCRIYLFLSKHERA